MANRWLRIPLADYEGHMKSAAVQQLDVLSALFGEVLARCQPESIAVIGIAGGNGLEHIDSSITRRIIGFDINPDYLDAVRQRYRRLDGLELFCTDLSQQVVAQEPVQLVHAALVFEHAGVGLCLTSALRLVADDGVLSVVLQLPGESEPAVGKSPFSSMHSLSSTFTLLDPERFVQVVEERGFRNTWEATRTLPSGKGLWMGVFTRAC